MLETLNTQALTRRFAADMAAGALGDDSQALLAWHVDGSPIVWQPSDAEMYDQRHIDAMRYWEALPKVDGVADTLNIDAVQLRSALGFLMLVEVGETGERFRYRVYGSEIARITNLEMTNKWLDETPTKPATICFLAGSYMAVCERKLPLYTVHAAPAVITTSIWHRLLLPLGTAGIVKRILVCMIPELSAHRGHAGFA